MKRTLKDMFLLAFGFFLLAVVVVWETKTLRPESIVQVVMAEPELLLEDSIQQVIGSVVHITNETQGWQGSGVLIASDIIVTARHIAEKGDDFTIIFNCGKTAKAHRALVSKKHDIGFIQTDEIVSSENPSRLGSIADCQLGQQVFAIGSPYGEVNRNSVTLGIISSLKRELENYDCPKEMGWSVTFQTDAAGHPGNSGCPIFTTDGVVRGILVGGFSNVLIYCVPVDVFMADIETVRAVFAADKYRFEEGFVPAVMVEEKEHAVD